jgi:hypothetical protein
MVALIVGLGVSQIGRRILHEVRLGLPVAEAIGLALVLGIHRAAGLDLPSAHMLWIGAANCSRGAGTAVTVGKIATVETEEKPNPG